MDTKTQDKKSPRPEEQDQDQPQVAMKKVETPQEFFDRVTARSDVHEIMTKLAKM
jgi:hypothetical protein